MRNTTVFQKMTTLKSNMNGLVFLTSTITTTFSNIQDRDKYIDYLKAGNSDYPLNVIRKAGVDMEKEDYLDAAFAVFERRLNEFEALVEKLGLA